MTNHTLKPVADEESRPFWEGLNNNELKIQHCDDCDKFIFYPRSICPHCFSERISWRVSSGRGKIYSYTNIRMAYGPFKEEAPFIIALVDLEEGVRMLTRISSNLEDVAIDKLVTVTFVKIEEDFALPYFKLI